MRQLVRCRALSFVFDDREPAVSLQQCLVGMWFHASLASLEVPGTVAFGRDVPACVAVDVDGEDAAYEVDHVDQTDWEFCWLAVVPEAVALDKVFRLFVVVSSSEIQAVPAMVGSKNEA